MNDVAALILAAGLSTRMGRPKVLLPWGNTTILGHVARTLADAGLSEILVVTGAAREEVEAEIAALPWALPLRLVHNPDFEQGDMLSSIQAGLAAMPPARRAALIALGDQPQMQAETVRKVLGAFAQDRAALVVPSFEKRRGHPWLVARSLWADLLAARPPATARDFLERHASLIEYVEVDNVSILKDVDTPADYERERPA